MKNNDSDKDKLTESQVLNQNEAIPEQIHYNIPV